VPPASGGPAGRRGGRRPPAAVRARTRTRDDPAPPRRPGRAAPALDPAPPPPPNPHPNPQTTTPQLNYGSATMLGSVSAMLLWALAAVVGFGIMAGRRRRAPAGPAPPARGGEGDAKEVLGGAV
jgi:hypothetical protein